MDEQIKVEFAYRIYRPACGMHSNNSNNQFYRGQFLLWDCIVDSLVAA
jgi:hypothetical protein